MNILIKILDDESLVGVAGGATAAKKRLQKKLKEREGDTWDGDTGINTSNKIFLITIKTSSTKGLSFFIFTLISSVLPP